jgi:hypothetical protein
VVAPAIEPGSVARNSGHETKRANSQTFRGGWALFAQRRFGCAPLGAGARGGKQLGHLACRRPCNGAPTQRARRIEASACPFQMQGESRRALSSPAPTLSSWVRIPLQAFVYSVCVCRPVCRWRLCAGLIPRPRRPTDCVID